MTEIVLRQDSWTVNKMAKSSELPDGLEADGRLLTVRDDYKSQVDYDDILPGDLLQSSGDTESFFFVHDRHHDGGISGWWFDQYKHSGGWSQDKDNCEVEFSRVAPSLARVVLDFYDRVGLAQERLDGKS